MAVLTWDGTGERLYETGDKNGVIYPQAANGSYPLGVAWNGLTAVTESPSGADVTDLWADDIKYASIRATETFGATIEAYTYPDEFAVCDGTAQPLTGVTVGQQPRKPFGFSFISTVGNDTEYNDHGYKVHLIYNATASPSEKSYTTINDSPDAITFSWEITTTPVSVADYDGHAIKPTSNIVIDSTKADSAKLAILLKVLHGTANTDPRLPLPDEVLGIMDGSVTPSFQ